MQPDNLRFYVLAGHALYAVIIRNAGDRPVLRRVKGSSGDHEPDFVNRVYHHGYYVSLTGLGLYKHPASHTDDGRLEGDYPPPPGSGLDCHFLGSDTVVLKETAGYFLEYPHAREALHTSLSAPFEPPFGNDTKAVLERIGYHPTIRISTEGDYAIPKHLLP